jgi:hypothetical protein
VADGHAALTGVEARDVVHEDVQRGGAIGVKVGRDGGVGARGHLNPVGGEDRIAVARAFAVGVDREVVGTRWHGQSLKRAGCEVVDE